MSTSRVFNGPAEMGLRALALLFEVSPDGLDLQRLVSLDYLIVHSGDVAGGPKSIHPPSPLRSGEIAVRRTLLEEGLKLLRLRGLIDVTLSTDGIQYVASDAAGAFLDALRAPYVSDLRARARWVAGTFSKASTSELNASLGHALNQWRAEFEVLGAALEDEE